MAAAVLGSRHATGGGGWAPGAYGPWWPRTIGGRAENWRPIGDRRKDECETVRPSVPGTVDPGVDAETGVLLIQEFSAATLRFLREAVVAHASAAGLSEERAVDVMLAVHELAANAVRHGAGSGRLRMEVTPGQLRCEVSDAGPQARAANGAAPWPVQQGHGLWVTRNAADQVSVTIGPGGSVVTVVFRVR